jgi:L-serine dehydratase
MISALDIFRIGIGPSSSHTVGPMRIAGRFLGHLKKADVLSGVVAIRACMQGSLAFTGKGHRTPAAILLGLLGFRPETTDPTKAEQALADLAIQKKLVLPNGKEIVFNPDCDLVLDYDTKPKLHPNGLRMIALGRDDKLIAEKIYFSTGGGFIASQRQLETPAQSDLVSGWQDGPFAFGSSAKLLELCQEHNSDIASILLGNEDERRPRDQTLEALDAIVSAMTNCIERGLHQPGILPRGLKVRRRAPDLYQKLLA